METKDLILLGFILSIIVPLAGLIICIIALNKLNKEQSTDRKGLAIAGIIISVVLMLLWLPLVGVLAYIGVLSPNNFIPPA